MKSKKIFILLGHPDSGPEPLSRHLADEYERSARAAGHDVRRTNLSDLSFDPILHKGYRSVQELEPSLVKVQEDLAWCEHFVLVYPNWWGGMPGALKGMWDRMFLPRFAFTMSKNSLGWEALLKGRTARVIITCGSPAVFDFFMFGDFSASIKRSILSFAGFKTRVTCIGMSEHISEHHKKGCMTRVSSLARNAK